MLYFILTFLLIIFIKIHTLNIPKDKTCSGLRTAVSSSYYFALLFTISLLNPSLCKMFLRRVINMFEYCTETPPLFFVWRCFVEFTCRFFIHSFVKVFISPVGSFALTATEFFLTDIPNNSIATVK